MVGLLHTPFQPHRYNLKKPRKRPDRSNSAKECHMKLKLRDQYVMNAVYASCLPDEDVRVAFACYVCVCVYA